ncbi:peptidase S8 [candidate division LCP-89 bacterium B3_LCP]|uniref:Peptidase S8 n=1 Tax=candidate division LCP-89 bacterium B3_LCP TaxID=2012998 RepID=A0A532UWA2_UNCL8|nr:MAG: peptidase S8 [candidate division LCP-89 bacterium B3_LCP]
MKKTLSLLICALFAATSFSVVATADQNADVNITAMDGSSINLKLWEEPTENGELATFYEINKNGRLLRRAQASYELGLRYAHFDPIHEVPAVESILAADENVNLYIVQFITQPIEEFQNEITQLGGTVHHYIAQFAYLVEMDSGVYEQVENLPYVRWVGQYHPAYRLEEYMLENLDNAWSAYPRQRFNIQVHNIEQKAIVADRISTLGGLVNRADAGKLLVEATLNPDQLFQVARWNEILFIDRWGPYEEDMDVVREIGGANYIESVGGFAGYDVRGESFDSGCQYNHQEFNYHPLLLHGTPSTASHGTATAGVCFASGVVANARGLLPEGQGITASYSYWGLTGGNRYVCSSELVQAPYNAVFQTASVGSPRTTTYTTFSADADAYCFDFDLVHCQSQSNSGWEDSRPQAWAKNMISGGGLYHYNTLDRGDDMWNNSASIGPASDGRVKPTFTHFYDMVYTTYSTSTTGYGQFSGTSSATPIIAGHVGLFFEMWDAGIFGNTVIPGGSVFENRAHMSTAKAMLVATAYQYDFSGPTHDKTRVHQGWGMPDLQKLYDMRNKIYVIDESDILAPFDVTQHVVTVSAGEPELKITLVYADPPGNPAVQTQHRINDLSLKVTSPGGTIYWGNRGLYDSPYSVSGGTADDKNTVENVFVENPQVGDWTVEISADEIIQDSHPETPELDADYALVVSGIEAPVLDVTIDIEPVSPPIVIPATGGSFDFDIVITNNETSMASFQAWIMVQLPDLTWFGPTVGPANLNIPASSFIDRTRSQSVPAGAPNGIYTYEARVGYYPNAIWHSDSFTFEKSTTGDGMVIEEWFSSGESLEMDYPTNSVSSIQPESFSMNQNYPNPFNPTTTLNFTLPEAAKVNLTVYDVSGRLVASLVDGFRQAGSHEVTFDGSGLASGIYIYQLKADGFTASGKMMLMK